MMFFQKFVVTHGPISVMPCFPCTFRVFDLMSGQSKGYTIDTQYLE